MYTNHRWETGLIDRDGNTVLTETSDDWDVEPQIDVNPLWRETDGEGIFDWVPSFSAVLSGGCYREVTDIYWRPDEPKMVVVEYDDGTTDEEEEYEKIYIGCVEAERLCDWKEEE